MSSWVDNIGNLFGITFGIFVAVCLLSFFAAGWRPFEQSGGRKIMKGGDFMRFLFAPSGSDENKSTMFWILTFIGIIVGLWFLLEFGIKMGGGGGGGKA